MIPPRNKNQTRKKTSYKEDSLQISISKYLQYKYPKVIFTAESAGMNRNVVQASKDKQLRSSRGLPDMMIFQPTEKYHGLFLELKQAGTSIICKIGERKGFLVSKEHIQEQHAILLDLRNKGYYAEFAVGIDEAMKIIDKYMAGEELPIYYEPIQP